MIDEERRAESIRVLGFDPYTQEYQAAEGLYKLTPERAAYILKYHNKNNRDFKDAQLKALSESVDEHGYQNDGDALRFDKDGNTPEYQHRCKTVVKKNITIHIPLVLGVSPDSFTKTAKAAARTSYDEIWRKDKSVQAYEVATLSEIILRRNQYSSKGEKLTLDKASSLWFEWKSTIHRGEKLTENFFKHTKVWNQFRRVFAAWAAMMWKHGKGKDATKFLDMLECATLGKETSPLAREFKEFWEGEQISYLKNTQRPRTIWFMLCVVSDRIVENTDGNCQFDLNLTECNHKTQKTNGHYRLFHRNPDNVKATVVLKIAA